MTNETNFSNIMEQRKSDERFHEIFTYILAEKSIAFDLARFFIGKKISSGEYRAVYEFDETSVIKVAPYKPLESNVLEYQIWQDVKDTKFAKWFAPCTRISPGGHFLIQKRAKPIGENDKLPTMLPDFFTDIKRTNFGYIEDHLVCFDYTFICRAIDTSFSSKRKIVWKP